MSDQTYMQGVIDSLRRRLENSEFRLDYVTKQNRTLKAEVLLLKGVLLKLTGGVGDGNSQ